MTAVDQLPYSYLTDAEETYRLGDLDAPALVLNATDAEGCQWWADEPEGWQAPTAATPMNDRATGDGGYAGATWFGPRTLAFGAGQTCVTVAPDRRTALRAAARLRSIVQSRDPVLYVQPGPDGDQALWLRASGQPKIRFLDGRVFEWAAVMVAEDPMRFDPRGAALTVGLPIAATGYTYPVTGNKVYGVTPTGTGTVTVANTGDETAPAVYTLTGPLVTPTVLNATTGAYFTLNRSIDAGATVVVDTASGTVELDGVSVFGDLRGGFPGVVPGTNRLQWSHRAAYNGVATLTVATTSTAK